MRLSKNGQVSFTPHFYASVMKKQETESRARQRVRLHAVLAYIDAHPDALLSLQELSAIAAWSPCHFHRQFSAMTGLPLARYVLLSRLRRAAQLLLHRREQPVLEIALASGYDSPEAFARAFRRVLGQSPSVFRAAARRPAWPELEQALNHAETMMNDPLPSSPRHDDVHIVDTPDRRVALLLHRGPPRELPASINRFIAWRRAHRLPPSRSATYNLFHDDVETTPPADYRLGLCAGLEHFSGPVEANPQGVVESLIPGGPCAVLRHVGTDHGLSAAAHFLYRDWLPASGRALRDFPLYLQRLSFFPDVPAQAAVSELFLPLQRA